MPIVLATMLSLVAVSAARAQTPPPFGVNDNGWWTFGDRPRYHDDLAKLGATLHRYPISWSAVQPWGPGSVNTPQLDDFDVAYQSDIARGIRPIIVLTSAPKWAADPADVAACAQTNYLRCAVPPSDANLWIWQAFVRWMVQRYPQAAAFEAWNEPNHIGYWHSAAGPDPERYGKIARLTAEAVHQADPAATALLSGTANAYWKTPQAMTTTTFVSRALAAGAATGMDGVSLHPYVADAATFPDAVMTGYVDGVLQMLATAGTPLPAWITETGVSRNQAGDGQPAMLVSLVNMWRARSDVRAVLVHDLVEGRIGTGFQLLSAWPTASGPPIITAAPSWCVLATAITGGPCPAP